MEVNKELQKAQMIISQFQQKLANADLTIASHFADLQFARNDLQERDEKIRNLEGQLAAKTT